MAINPARRKYWFETLVNLPGAWLGAAEALRLAADRVDLRPIDFHNPSPIGCRLIPIQKMLMGLSFENLLKGLLIAYGRPAEDKGRLATTVGNHDFGKLLEQFRPSELTLNSDEKELLRGLQRHVTWRGRYPVPRGPEQYESVYWSVNDQARERVLWDRLRTQLQLIGWALGPDGERVPLTGRSLSCQGDC